MYIKPIGSTQNVTMTGSPQVVYVTTTQVGVVFDVPNRSIPAHTVRIATSTQPAFVTIDGSTATSTTAILIPANAVEYFKLTTVKVGTTSTTGQSIGQISYVASSATIQVLQAGAAGIVSITPIS